MRAMARILGCRPRIRHKHERKKEQSMWLDRGQNGQSTVALQPACHIDCRPKRIGQSHAEMCGPLARIMALGTQNEII